MSAESPSPAKKQRVLSWKPEELPDQGGRGRRMPRWMAIVAGVGITLLLVVILAGALVVYRLDKMRREAAVVAQIELVPGDNLRAAFVTRSRAEFAREAAMNGIQNVRKVPTDHPAVLRRLISIERIMLTADKAFGDANYGIAVKQYEAVAAETKQFGAALEDMRKAREGYDRFLVDFARMERMRPLAPDKFDAALTSAGAAQTFLTEGSFSVAREKIEEAGRTLASVETSVTAELEKALAAGRAALAQGDGEAAKAAFQRALELQTDHAVALEGLERAATIGQVFTMLREAEALENAARFEEAQAIFEKTFKIDGKSATAQAGIARMKTSIRERDFKAAIDSAVAAREDGRWNDAIAAYEEAIKLRPDDKDLKEQVATARVEQREAYIQDSLAAAYDFERQYDWDNSRRVYLDLLKFQPDQPDAIEGLSRTGKVLRALLKFERLVDDARSQAQRASFQTAIGAFNEALANKPSYLALTPEQEELRLMLERQSRPIQVSFVSDSKTYVTIQGLRLLGRFEQTSIGLLPGNYEVIGRRRGYQDVREFVRVRGDDPMQPITIIANTRM